MMKRYIIELGTGVDLHGSDPNKAVARAVDDAVRHSCLCGLEEVLGLKDLSEILIKVTIACPDAKRLDLEKVKAQLPMGRVEIEDVQEGGLRTKGACAAGSDGAEEIFVALVSLAVYVPA